jgi:hypothetical protein
VRDAELVWLHATAHSSSTKSANVGLFLAIAGLLLCSCADSYTFTTRRETLNYATVQPLLRPGITVPADVEFLLGKPSGKGLVILPADPRPQTAWFYEKLDISAKNLKSTRNDPKPTPKTDLRRTTFIVLFSEERLSGYLWFSDAKGAAQ